MAEISLEAYQADIDQLIEAQRFAEAVAHCQHILITRPRFVPVYRLLGKALLEQQAFHDAADVFQRVLSTEPEDFIAHVGLSIVYKEDGLIAQAVWHMERAYELDPYNAVIQNELKDLYFARDEVLPERLPLTGGALARLHVKGGLYQPAVVELRRLLAADESRVDLQTLLAEALWRDDQHVDAVDVCLDVLHKLPNCIRANAILSAVWLDNGRVDEAQTFLKRLKELTLYHSSGEGPVQALVQRVFAQPGAPLLPEEVMVERLNYVPDGLVEDEEGLPDWVQALDMAEDMFGDSEPAAAADVAALDDMPEWLRAMDSSVGANLEPGDADAFLGEETDLPPEYDRALSVEEGELDGGNVADQSVDAGTPPVIGEGLEESGGVEAQEFSLFEEQAEAGDEGDAELIDPDVPDWLSGILDDESFDEAMISEPDSDEEIELVEVVAPLESQDVPEDVEPAFQADENEGLEGVSDEGEDGFAWSAAAPIDESLQDDEWLAAPVALPVDDQPAGLEEDWGAIDFDFQVDETAPTDAESADPPWIEVAVPDSSADEGDAAGDEANRSSTGADGDDPSAWLSDEGADWDDEGEAAGWTDWLGQAAAASAATADKGESDEYPSGPDDMSTRMEDMMMEMSDDPAQSDPEPFDDEELFGDDDLSGDDALDWLEELASATTAPVTEAVAEQNSPDDIPDWLKEDLAGEGDSTSVPDWLQGDALEPGAVLTEAAADLDAVAPEETDDFAGLPVAPEAGIAETDSAEGSLEDLGWLDAIAAGEGPPLEEPPTLSWSNESAEDDPAAIGGDDPDMGAADLGEAMDWIEELAEPATADDALSVAPAASVDAVEPVELENEVENLDWLSELSDDSNRASEEDSKSLDWLGEGESADVEELVDLTTVVLDENSTPPGAQTVPDLLDVDPSAAAADEESDALAWLDALVADDSDSDASLDEVSISSELPVPATAADDDVWLDELLFDDEDAAGDDDADAALWADSSESDQPDAVGAAMDVDQETATGPEAELDFAAEDLVTGDAAEAEPMTIMSEGERMSGLDLPDVEDSDADADAMAWLDELVADVEAEEAASAEAVFDEAAPDMAVPDEAVPDEAAPDMASFDADATIIGAAPVMDETESVELPQLDMDLDLIDELDDDDFDYDMTGGIADDMPGAEPLTLMIDGEPVSGLELPDTEDPVSEADAMAWLDELMSEAETDDATVEAVADDSAATMIGAALELDDVEADEVSEAELDFELADEMAGVVDDAVATGAAEAEMDFDFADEMADVSDTNELAEAADESVADMISDEPMTLMINGERVTGLDLPDAEDPSSDADAMAWLDELMEDVEVEEAAAEVLIDDPTETMIGAPLVGSEGVHEEAPVAEMEPDLAGDGEDIDWLDALKDDATVDAAQLDSVIDDADATMVGVGPVLADSEGVDMAAADLDLGITDERADAEMVIDADAGGLDDASADEGIDDEAMALLDELLADMEVDELFAGGEEAVAVAAVGTGAEDEAVTDLQHDFLEDEAIMTTGEEDDSDRYDWPELVDTATDADSMAWLDDLAEEGDEAIEPAGAAVDDATMTMIGKAPSLDDLGLDEILDGEETAAAVDDVIAADESAGLEEVLDGIIDAEEDEAEPMSLMIDGKRVSGLELPDTEDPISDELAMAWLDELIEDAEADSPTPDVAFDASAETMIGAAPAEVDFESLDLPDAEMGPDVADAVLELDADEPAIDAVTLEDDLVDAEPMTLMIDGERVRGLDLPDTEDPTSDAEVMGWLDELMEDAAAEEAAAEAAAASVAEAGTVDDIADTMIGTVPGFDELDLPDAPELDMDADAAEAVADESLDLGEAEPITLMIDGERVKGLDLPDTEDPISDAEAMAWLDELMADAEAEEAAEQAAARMAAAELDADEVVGHVAHDAADTLIGAAPVLDEDLLPEVPESEMELDAPEPTSDEGVDLADVEPVTLMIDGERVHGLDLPDTEDPISDADAMAWLDELMDDAIAEEAGAAEAAAAAAVPEDVIEGVLDDDRASSLEVEPAPDEEEVAEALAALALDETELAEAAADSDLLEALADAGTPEDEIEAVRAALTTDLADEIPDDPDEAMAWLESMAAQEMDDSGVEMATPPSLSAATRADSDAKDMLEMPEDPDEAMAWLESMSDQAEEAAAEPVAAAPDEAESAGDDIVSEDDLSDLGAALDDINLDLPSDALSDALPDWLTAEPVGAADEGIDWLDAIEDANLEGWLSAEEEATETVQSGLYQVAAPPDSSAVTPAEPRADSVTPAEAPAPMAMSEVDHPWLAKAHAAVATDDVEAAVAEYSRLLDSGEDLDILIADLAANSAAVPAASLIRLLGDAHMRKGQLQQALDSYRKALDNM